MFTIEVWNAIYKLIEQQVRQASENEHANDWEVVYNRSSEKMNLFVELKFNEAESVYKLWASDQFDDVTEAVWLADDWHRGDPDHTPSIDKAEAAWRELVKDWKREQKETEREREKVE